MTDIVALTAGPEPAPSLEQFGYRQELKRALGLFDLTVYGLIFIGLTAPFAYFGIVYNASHGMVPLVFAVGAVAMSFTAVSYVTMSRAFPIAGSVYAYAGRGIGASVGFLAGWAMLLDYVLLPTLVYVVIAVAIQAVVPAVKGGLSTVGRATVLALCVAGLLFVVETYLLSLFVLDQPRFAEGAPTDGAVYAIAEIIGGPSFKLLASFKVLLATAGALASQTATARLLFSMARDGTLPRLLAHVHPRRQVPERAILLCAGINLAVGLALANHMELLTTMVSFGALFGFMTLHLAVMVHFLWRQKSRAWLRHGLVPLIGFAIMVYALMNMARPATIAGIIWLMTGVAALGGLRLAGRPGGLPA